MSGDRWAIGADMGVVPSWTPAVGTGRIESQAFERGHRAAGLFPTFAEAYTLGCRDLRQNGSRR